YTPDAADPYPWSLYSKNDYLGIEQNVDMSGLVRAVEALTGTKFIHSRAYVPQDWDSNQQAKAVLKHEQTEKEVPEAEATEMIQVVEVAIADAFEDVEITELVQDGTKLVYSYQLDASGVMEVVSDAVPNMVEHGTGEFRKQLLAGVGFNSDTGKFTEMEGVQVPTSVVKDGFRKDETTGKYYRPKTHTEAVTSVTAGDIKDPPKWLADRLPSP
ncbi:unnamed protein product, partial [marine sediment metagenome]